MSNKLISEYRSCASLHGKKISLGNSVETNLAYDDLYGILQQIVENEADDGLFRLFEDEDLWVQLWAATHTLEVDELKACRKLQEIADASVPIISMSARYTLQEWKDGELHTRG